MPSFVAGFRGCDGEVIVARLNGLGEGDRFNLALLVDHDIDLALEPAVDAEWLMQPLRELLPNAHRRNHIPILLSPDPVGAGRNHLRWLPDRERPRLEERSAAQIEKPGGENA